MVIWYILSRFGMFYQEKSGNPVPEANLDSFSPDIVVDWMQS
jgi:hypothetical protein